MFVNTEATNIKFAKHGYLWSQKQIKRNNQLDSSVTSRPAHVPHSNALAMCRDRIGLRFALRYYKLDL